MKQQYIDSDGQVLCLVIYKTGSKYYFNSKNQYHRLDGPALISNNNYAWYKENKRHRIGGPAVYIFLSQNWPEERWFVNDKLINIYYICG